MLKGFAGHDGSLLIKKFFPNSYSSSTFNLKDRIDIVVRKFSSAIELNMQPIVCKGSRIS